MKKLDEKVEPIKLRAGSLQGNKLFLYAEDNRIVEPVIIEFTDTEIAWDYYCRSYILSEEKQ